MAIENVVLNGIRQDLPTHAGSYGLHTKIVHKSANETINNDATLQNDDHLFLPVLANEVWNVEVYLIFSSHTTPDLKVGWAYPTGTTIAWVGTFSGTSLAETSTDNPSGLGTGVKKQVWYGSTVYVGATAGNIQFQWAQNVATVADTVVYASSFIRATQLV